MINRVQSPILVHNAHVHSKNKFVGLTMMFVIWGSLCQRLAFIHHKPFELSKLYSGMLLTTFYLCFRLPPYSEWPWNKERILSIRRERDLFHTVFISVACHFTLSFTSPTLSLPSPTLSFYFAFRAKCLYVIH